MQLRMFCVRDRATEVYGTPMFLVTTGQAVRSFSDEVNREAADNQLYTHPDDFDLFLMGDWNNDSGEFVLCAPECVCRAKDVSTKFNGVH
ncbi:MAG: nonstructural protein [Microvirus sp.]|nr:MAG: nonstructural protein [Microvirus sp.]